MMGIFHFSVDAALVAAVTAAFRKVSQSQDVKRGLHGNGGVILGHKL